MLEGTILGLLYFLGGLIGFVFLCGIGGGIVFIINRIMYEPVNLINQV
jgi:hypothetical protein